MTVLGQPAFADHIPTVLTNLKVKESREQLKHTDDEEEGKDSGKRKLFEGTGKGPGTRMWLEALGSKAGKQHRREVLAKYVRCFD